MKFIVLALAVFNGLLILVTWYFYFRVWWAISQAFEGAVPFHVVMIGASYMILAALALEHLDGWRGLLTIIAYAMTAGSLGWILWYERARFIKLRKGRTP